MSTISANALSVDIYIYIYIYIYIEVYDSNCYGWYTKQVIVEKSSDWIPRSVYCSEI